MSYLRNLKQIREFRNYSQEYLAEKLGISQETYSRIENGTVSLTVNRLILIAEILQVDCSNLLSCTHGQHVNLCLKECEPAICNLGTIGLKFQCNKEKIKP